MKRQVRRNMGQQRLCILFMTPTMSYGGAESVMLRLVRGAVARRWEVHTAFDDDAVLASLAGDHQAAGASHHVLAIGERGEWRGSTKIRFLRTARVLRRVGPDVAQLHLGWPDMGFGPLMACAALSIPTAVVFHSLASPTAALQRRRRCYSWARGRCQQWVCVSKAGQASVAACLRAPVDAIERIPNGVDEPCALRGSPEGEAIRVAVRKELGLHQDALAVLSVGRLEHMKGHDELVQVAPHLREHWPQIRFVWAGGGSQTQRYQATLRQYGLSDSVTMLGYRTDVDRLMLGADLLAFPSYSESMSLALLQAMALGLPMVASDVPGIAELVEDGVHGVLCRPGDSADLLEKMRWALRHPIEMAGMADGARRRARAFTTARMVQAHLDLSASLADRRGAICGQRRSRRD